MIDINRLLFKRLEALLPEDAVVSSGIKIGESAIRHIHTNSIEERVLQEIDVIDEIKLIDNSYLATLKYEDQTFLIIGSHYADEISDFFHGLEIPSLESDVQISNSGLMTYLWSRDKFSFAPRSSEDLGYELLERVFCKEGIKDGEFQMDEIAPYFLRSQIWLIDKEIIPTTNIHSLHAFYTAFVLHQSGQNLFLNLSQNTQSQFLNLVTNSPHELIGSAIYNSIFSTNWNHCFLELYRCIEFLYPIPQLMDYANVIGDLSLLPKLYIHTEDVLKWRPPEEKALQRVFKDLDEVSSSIKVLKECFEKIETHQFDEKDHNYSLTSKRIYQLRNSIAHFRLSLKYDIKSGEQFDDLIACLIGVIIELYDQYKSAIIDIKSFVN